MSTRTFTSKNYPMPSTATNIAAADQDTITIDRRRGERRDGNPEAVDTGVMKKPRRKANRRRHIDPTTCERDYSDQEVEFMRAMDDYKRKAGRMFPTCSEVLEVLRDLGYHQLSDSQAETLGLVGDEEIDVEESSDEFEDAAELEAV